MLKKTAPQVGSDAARELDKLASSCKPAAKPERPKGGEETPKPTVDPTPAPAADAEAILLEAQEAYVHGQYAKTARSPPGTRWTRRAGSS